MRTYWLHQSERWIQLIDSHASAGNLAAVKSALEHLDFSLSEAIQ